MANLVIDASVASAWCFPDEQTAYTNGVLHAVASSLIGFAPRLWAYEIRNSVLMGLRRGRITKTDAEEFLISLGDLNIHLADPVSYEVVFAMAQSNGLTVYDAAYLDLAIREGSELATVDIALRKAAVERRCSFVQLLKTTQCFDRWFQCNPGEARLRRSFRASEAEIRCPLVRSNPIAIKDGDSGAGIRPGAAANHFVLARMGTLRIFGGR